MSRLTRRSIIGGLAIGVPALALPLRERATTQKPATPEQFGAVGDGIADDTLALQRMFDTGRPARLDRDYVSSGNTLRADNMVVSGTGSLIKKAGFNGQLLVIAGNGTTVALRRLTGFNGTAVASAHGRTLTVKAASGGIIRVDTYARFPSGTPIDGDRLRPGTMIVGYGTGKGGPGTYQLSRPHEFDDLPIRFVDAPSFWWVNDIIRNTGDDTTIVVGLIEGAGGNGITNIGGARLKVRDTTIRNVHDNGILSAEAGADDVDIRDVLVEGTALQNGIFITASAGSAISPAFVTGANITRTVCRHCGDTALELGYHSRRATVTDCELGPSVNPPLLWRDSSDITCARIKLVPPPPDEQSADWCAFAAVPLHEAADWDYRGSLSEVRFEGYASGAVARLGGSGITLARIRAIGRSKARSAKSNAFVSLAGDVSAISIRSCVASNFTDAIQANFGTAPVTLSDISIENNTFSSTAVGLNGFKVTWKNSRYLANRADSPSRTGILLSMPPGRNDMPDTALKTDYPTNIGALPQRTLEVHRL